MKWQTMIVTLIAIPVLALFGGIGFLAWRIGETWDARSTDSLITGLVATCGGGAVIIGVLLALIVGIPLALRTYGEAGRVRQQWRNLPSPSPDWEPMPKQLPNTIEGEYQRLPPPPAAEPMPIWGATGGGNTLMLPAHKQDKRFRMDASMVDSSYDRSG